MRSYLTYFILGVVALAGLTLRTWNVNFDGGLNAHPDERSTTCFYAPSIGWPSSSDEFLDPQRSPLNPLWDRQNDRRRSFTYGHFPLYLGILTGEMLSDLAQPAALLPLSDRTLSLMQRANHACAGVAVAGRLMMALLDTLTILLIFLVGRRLYGAAAGLLAATLYAFTAQAVQLSHFFAMDPSSTTFVVLSVYGGIVMVQDRSWRGVIWAGIGAGLAISAKFSALPVLAVPIVAALAAGWRSDTSQGSYPTGQPASDSDSAAGDIHDRKSAGRMLLGAPVALFLAFIAFFVTSPYAILDWHSFIQATLVEQGRMVRGIADFPFTRQYRNTTPYLYFIRQQVVWGMGLPLGLIALAGSFWALAKSILLRPRLGELVVWAWVIPYFGLTGAFLAKFNRYMSPILPFVLLFAAGMILWLWKLGDGRRLRLPVRLPAALLALVAVAGALSWSLSLVNGVYAREHTWITASRWVYANAPPGSVILWESWDDPLPKSMPGEPGMDMGSHGLRHIDWSPYEEDTEEKYAILRQKLQEADYVIYSSKRIYESVDELPQRYPMTIRYYELMFGERLGFAHAADFTSPPQLLGFTFPDHEADESWSLYDHPRVSIFAKQTELNETDYDALLHGSWEGAIPWHRGEDPPLSPLLNALGLGSAPESEQRGLVNIVFALLQGQEIPSGDRQPAARREEDGQPSLLLETPLDQLPLVDNYRWNRAASNNTWLAVAWWWLVISLLGWTAWPLSFLLFRALRDRGYLLAKTLGWLLCGWLLWMFASLDLAHNTVQNAWLAVAFVALVNAALFARNWRPVLSFLRRMWGILLVGEALFAAAFVFFVLVRRANPDLWQPWFGGEKFMEFAFLNGILRSPTFPPVDPHFAGGYINYYYYGIYLVGYLVKLTGIYAEVAFNLAIPTLFALTVLNAFAVAYSVSGRRRLGEPISRLGDPLFHSQESDIEPHPSTISELSAPPPPPWQTQEGRVETFVLDTEPPSTESWDEAQDVPDQLRFEGEAAVNAGPVPIPELAQTDSTEEAKPRSESPLDDPPPDSGSANVQPTPWYEGVASALLAPLFVAVLGNLAGFGQLLHSLSRASQSQIVFGIPAFEKAIHAVGGLWRTVTTGSALPNYDFWAPSRVIPETINEFPYWSFTYADLHPHMIGIPFSLLFVALALTLLNSFKLDWSRHWPYFTLLFGGFSFTLGVLTAVNLWELPTYFGLGILVLAVALHRKRGRLLLGRVIMLGVVQLVVAYLLFLPFFRNYTNVAAGGIGFVRAPDQLGHWVQIWGFFAFVLFSWLLVGRSESSRLRFLSLHRLLVRKCTPVYFTGTVLSPILFLASALLLVFSDQIILAICLPALGISLPLLLRRGRASDTGTVVAALLTSVGLAVLAGTQLVYLKDFLQGGNAYRMNTLFKFFSQVWVLWGVAAAIVLPRILARLTAGKTGRSHAAADGKLLARRGTGWPIKAPLTPVGRVWGLTFAFLLAASLAFPLWGTPSRLAQRFPGWRPPVGTLDGIAFMENGAYRWPDGDNAIELRYDWEAIRWILENVRGNAVVAESAQIDYYRAGGTRVASLTGLSGLLGMHAGEQRFAQDVGERHGKLSEFWRTNEIGRIEEIIRELDIDLIYVGQLERHQHPAAPERFEQLKATGLLETVFQNQKVTIYAVPSQWPAGPTGR